jgi:hypothetical protein
MICNDPILGLGAFDKSDLVTFVDSRQPIQFLHATTSTRFGTLRLLTEHRLVVVEAQQPQEDLLHQVWNIGRSVTHAPGQITAQLVPVRLL